MITGHALLFYGKYIYRKVMTAWNSADLLKMAIKGFTAVRDEEGTPLFWAVTGFPVKCLDAEWAPHSLWLAV